jgi:hypothetical protein
LKWWFLDSLSPGVLLLREKKKKEKKKEEMVILIGVPGSWRNDH